MWLKDVVPPAWPEVIPNTTVLYRRSMFQQVKPCLCFPNIPRWGTDQLNTSSVTHIYGHWMFGYGYLCFENLWGTFYVSCSSSHDHAVLNIISMPIQRGFQQPLHCKYVKWSWLFNVSFCFCSWKLLTFPSCTTVHSAVIPFGVHCLDLWSRVPGIKCLS